MLPGFRGTSRMSLLIVLQSGTGHVRQPTRETQRDAVPTTRVSVAAVWLLRLGPLVGQALLADGLARGVDRSDDQGEPSAEGFDPG